LGEGACGIPVLSSIGGYDGLPILGYRGVGGVFGYIWGDNYKNKQKRLPTVDI
jgi:hypothetical protein